MRICRLYTWLPATALGRLCAGTKGLWRGVEVYEVLQTFYLHYHELDSVACHSVLIMESPPSTVVLCRGDKRVRLSLDDLEVSLA